MLETFSLFISCVAMVSYAGLPQYFVDILEDHCPFVREPSYMHPDGCHHRDKDYFEMFSGVGNLWREVCMDRYVAMTCFATVCRSAIPCMWDVLISCMYVKCFFVLC